MNPEAGDRWIDPTMSIEEQTENRDRKTERGAGPELACSEWMDALAENLRAEADKCLELGTKHNAPQYDVAYVVLDRLATAVARTGISASIER